MIPFEEDTRRRQRFAFGANWARFLSALNDDRIHLAEQSLRSMLEVKDLGGKSFLDVGSGSGLFSLAARRLGARVRSFDYDSLSVACTAELKRRWFPGDAEWVVEQGSVLDLDYLGKLGEFDIVYAWGVLHHTGAMWEAMDNAAKLVDPGGRLFIAIYNSQRQSRIWLEVKRTYNHLPRGLRWLVLAPSLTLLWGPRTVHDLLRGRPFSTWRNYAEHGLRGMSAWRDVVDWVGGFPFEVARPEEVFDFYRARGFSLERLKTCGGGIGCNEYVFSRHDHPLS